MSTRSGKRIHSSIEEQVVEHIFQVKSERNTRSKQQKINNDLPLNEKKRKHYVRYPSEEEITSAETECVDNMVKNTRKSRRHTLKELNKLVDKSEPSIGVKAERLTRRSKKIGEKNDLVHVELSLAKEEKKKAKKKIKANGENIDNVPDIDTQVNIKKKSNKKKNKKKSNSLTVTDVSETVNKKLNKSNASNDSFHSAAGSPVVHHLISSNTNNGVHNESSKTKKNNENILEKVLNMNSSTDKQNRKRKQNIEITCNQLNDLVRNSLREELPSQPEPDQLESTNDIETINNKTFEKNNSITSLNKSVGLDSKKTPNQKASYDNIHNINTTFEIDNADKGLNSSIHKLATKRSFNNIFKEDKMSETFSNISDNGIRLNATFDMQNHNQSDTTESNSDGVKDITYSGSKKRRKSSIKNSTYDKIDDSPVKQMNTMFENDLKKNTPITDRDRESVSTIDSIDQNNTKSLNTTYDKNTKTSISCLSATFEKPLSLDSTFDKSLKKDSIDQFKMQPTAKSSLLSSDTTDNSSLNITDDNSHVSINSDDSKSDNIVNTTPVLIESSMDESKTNTPGSVVDPGTIKNTLRREGTFTEETKTSAFIQEVIFVETQSKHTPSKSKGMLEENKISPQEPSLLESESECTSLITTQITPKKNLDTTTETILLTTPLKREGTFTKDSPDVMSPKLCKDITPRRKSLPSPGYTPYPVSKSSSKGKGVLNVTRSIEKSRRSSVADVAPRMTRVMFCSPENNPSVVTQMKGKVIKSNLKGSNKSFVFDESVSSLSRPARKRSYTQTEAEAEPSPGPPRQRTASAAGRLQAGQQAARRTKLPNFAALHQKQFERMESLDAWQQRRSKRARLLSTPPALRPAANESQQKTQQSESSTKKIETPKAQQQGAGPGFTKFGFKLNLDVNPFSFPQPQNTEVKPKEKKPLILKRQATLPSLAGATALRREIAKQTIMREKSYTEKKNVNRKETRTVIKGVRTNRRFELQMKMRNINN